MAMKMLTTNSSPIWMMPPATCLNLVYCRDATDLFVKCIYIYVDSSFISKARSRVVLSTQSISREGR